MLGARRRAKHAATRAAVETGGAAARPPPRHARSCSLDRPCVADTARAADAVLDLLILVEAEAGGEEGAQLFRRDGVAIVPTEHGDAPQRLEPLVGEPGIRTAATEKRAEGNRQPARFREAGETVL